MLYEDFFFIIFAINLQYTIYYTLDANFNNKYDTVYIFNCKREVAHIRFGHVLLQICSAWMDKAQEVTWTKMPNSEKVCKQLSSEEDDSGHVECRYKIIGGLISIKVL